MIVACVGLVLLVAAASGGDWFFAGIGAALALFGLLLDILPGGGRDKR